MDLYLDDIISACYSAYGHYGHENFMELARRLGIVETKRAKIPDQFAKSNKEVNVFYQWFFLSAGAKTLYLSGFGDKLKCLVQAEG